MNTQPAVTKPTGIILAASPIQLKLVQQQRRLEQVKSLYPKRVGLFQRVYAGKASPRLCVKAFCLECNGWEERAIRECTALACPLYGLRPFQTPRKNEKPRDKA